MKAPTLAAALFIIATYLIGCGGGGLSDIAQNAIYPAASVNKTPVPEEPPAPLQQHYLDITTSTQSISVHVWYYRQPNINAPVVIYMHGNGENLATVYRAGTFGKLANTLGAHVVAFDYPSYGRTTGTPSEESLTASGLATIEWASQTFSSSKIFVWGWSLGAAVASQTAHHPKVSKFALTSPWSNLKELASTLFSGLVGLVPKQFFEANRWDSVEAAQSFSTEGIIFHGTEDKTIPYALGQKVYAAHDSSKVTFVPLQGKEHNDVFLDEKLWEGLSQLFK